MKLEKLEKILTYDKNSGIFTWIRSGHGIKKGSIAGSVNKTGHIRINIDKKQYQISHLARLFEYGTMPLKMIDHINGNPLDNRIVNLREASYTDNNKNKAIGKNNLSGVLGVSWFKAGNKWKAYITIDKKIIHLGYFNKFSEAVDTRKLAEVAYGFHENHGKRSAICR